MMSFKDKVVIVTGAGGGIGSAIAARFAALGAKLTLVDIDNDRVLKTRKICIEKGAKESDILHTFTDLSRKDDEKRIKNIIIIQTLHLFGRIDILINNAAISSKQSIFEENYMENYDAIFNINVKAPMLLTQLAVPHLVANRGNVINITSVGGIHPLPGLSIYNTSKSALSHFTKCVARELAPHGVRVNSIAPAGVKTNMVKLLGVQDVEEFERKRAAQLPLKKMIEPSEVAELVEFLASDKAGSITGTEFVIDGGHLLGGETPEYA